MTSLPRPVGDAIWITKRLLFDTGYIKTVRPRTPIDHRGEPTPWYTYPAIEYLRQLDWSDRRVFEFGSGYSTLFWQRRARSVRSVEHDREWHDRIKPMLDERSTLVLHEDEDSYAREPVDSASGPFDIVVVDGIHRPKCAVFGLLALAPGGLVILDNSDWYPGVAAWLRDHGLLQVDFTGFGPVNPYAFTTSLFFDRSIELRPLGTQPCVGPAGMPRPEGVFFGSDEFPPDADRVPRR